MTDVKELAQMKRNIDQTKSQIDAALAEFRGMVSKFQEVCPHPESLQFEHEEDGKRYIVCSHCDGIVSEVANASDDEASGD